jgi:hypothetical protein
MSNPVRAASIARDSLTCRRDETAMKVQTRTVLRHALASRADGAVRIFARRAV